jgi:RNA 2',3'-cyclic 3'-phosphodiesterase
VRAFVAIRAPLPQGPAVLDLASEGERHLTLLFLGEIEERHVELIGAALDAALAPYPSFDLRLGGVGAFPTHQHPRVVWAGVTAGCNETIALAAQVVNLLAPLGFRGDGRPFVPHVTLFRVRTPVDRRRAESLLAAAAELSSATVRVTEVLLRKSTLTRSGAIHETLHRSPLGTRTAIPGPESGSA